jgi:hypothetical protein
MKSPTQIVFRNLVLGIFPLLVILAYHGKTGWVLYFTAVVTIAFIGTKMWEDKHNEKWK